MGFWFFMLFMNLLIPFTMIGFGKYFMKLMTKLSSMKKEEIKTPLGKVKKMEKDYLQRLVNFIFI